MTYDQVWWPILWIFALHLTHPKSTHTAVKTHTPWTYTQSSGQPFMLRRPWSSWGFGALLKGTSVVVLRVERALDFHSPHQQFLPARDSNPQPLGYESYSLTIRPWLSSSPIMSAWCRCWASFMKHENKFLYKSFVKLFWRKLSNSYFQNVCWYERNVHLLPITWKWCVKPSVLFLANWWHRILMHCLYNILQVCLLCFIF